MKIGIFVKAIVGLACAAVFLSGQETPVAKQPKPKSQKEVEAVMAMFNAADADARIKAANELVTNFADTEFKEIALLMTAMTYQQKNDVDNMIIFAERTLEANPQSYQAMLMIAESLAQRTRENDLDREEKLGRSEKLANGSIEAISKAPKARADVTDEQWAGAKKDFIAQAHQALGMAAMARKKYDVAIAEFKVAIEGATQPDPATMVRLGAVYNMAGKHDEAIAALDKVMAITDLHPTIRQFAQAEKVRAMQAKGGAKPAAPANAPAPVEIKK
jgi:tetratricopeptide (TPR) repeat protein